MDYKYKVQSLQAAKAMRVAMESNAPQAEQQGLASEFKEAVLYKVGECETYYVNLKASFQNLALANIKYSSIDDFRSPIYMTMREINSEKAYEAAAALNTVRDAKTTLTECNSREVGSIFKVLNDLDHKYQAMPSACSDVLKAPLTALTAEFPGLPEEAAPYDVAEVAATYSETEHVESIVIAVDA